MKFASAFALAFIIGAGCTGLLRAVLREARSELDGRECYVVECQQCGGYQDPWAAQYDPACRVRVVECVMCFECANRAQRVNASR